MLASPEHPIYLDYAATTPVDDRVLQAMLPFFKINFGNSSSVHFFGQQAEAALEESREITAKVLGCSPNEVIFTSCGTESDNLALRGSALAGRKSRGANHLLISPVEHHAVSKTAEQLASEFGFELEYLPVDSFGEVDPQEVASRIRTDTAVVSVIYANNEIGTINPIAEIGKICRQRKVPFHSDAVQAAGYLTVDTTTLEVDLLSLGAHKFYGPKGVGALFIRKSAGCDLLPVQTGGGQEFGQRAGTHNIPYIAGMAHALNLAQAEHLQRIEHVRPMRDYLIGQVLENIPEARLTGHPVKRLPNHASFVFKDLDGNVLLTLLDLEGFACSSGSACKTGNPEPSEVLNAVGLERAWTLGSLRVTLGSHSTAAQIESFTQVLPGVVERARRMSAKR